MRGGIAGWHLTYDGIVNSKHAVKLYDVEFLQKVMLELVDELNMEVLVGPRFHRVEFQPENLETDADEGGVTGMVVITTSHISIHTWPLRERFSLDVYSCRKFDEYKTVSWLSEKFNVKRRVTHWIPRHWP